MTHCQQQSGFVEAKDCKEDDALPRGEDGVGAEEDLEGTGVDRVVYDEPADGEGDGSEHSNGEAAEQEGVSEHLDARYRGPRSSTEAVSLAEQEEDDEDGGQCQQVDGDAEIVLAGSKHHEVFGRVRGDKEEQRGQGERKSQKK